MSERPSNSDGMLMLLVDRGFFHGVPSKAFWEPTRGRMRCSGKIYWSWSNHKGLWPGTQCLIHSQVAYLCPTGEAILGLMSISVTTSLCTPVVQQSLSSQTALWAQALLKLGPSKAGGERTPKWIDRWEHKGTSASQTFAKLGLYYLWLGRERLFL